MAKAKAVTSTPKKKPAPAAPRTAVQEALQVTFVLKGNLKRAQLLYLFIGSQLFRVRDEKLYAELHHPDLESHAAERLQLGRASLYRYLQVYDWARAFHRECTEPDCPGFIPDLSDAADLMWIEQEPARKDLDRKQRAALAALRQRGLDGRLREGELDRWRRAGHGEEDGLKSFLSKLRLLRRRGAQLASMPPEAIGHLDAAIDILTNVRVLKVAGMDRIELPNEYHRCGNLVA
jgi:hypothetical protein